MRSTFFIIILLLAAIGIVLLIAGYGFKDPIFLLVLGLEWLAVIAQAVTAREDR